MSTEDFSTIPADQALSIKKFGEHDIQMLPHDGDLWVTGESIGVALEYPEPRKAIVKVYERHRSELETYSCVVKVTSHDSDGTARRRAVRVYNEEGVMIITMLSRQPKAAEFRRWAVQILKAYRHGELVMAEPKDRDQILAICLKEVSKGNVAAMDTLIHRYGYRPEFKDEQLRVLLAMRGKDASQLDLGLSGQGGGR